MEPLPDPLLTLAKVFAMTLEDGDVRGEDGQSDPFESRSEEDTEEDDDVLVVLSNEQ